MSVHLVTGSFITAGTLLFKSEARFSLPVVLGREWYAVDCHLYDYCMAAAPVHSNPHEGSDTDSESCRNQDELSLIFL